MISKGNTIFYLLFKIGGKLVIGRLGGVSGPTLSVSFLFVFILLISVDIVLGSSSATQSSAPSALQQVKYRNPKIARVKGSCSRERRGAEKVANGCNMSRTVAIEVYLKFAHAHFEKNYYFLFRL